MRETTKCSACGVCCGALELGPLPKEEVSGLDTYERQGNHFITRIARTWAPWSPFGVCVYLTTERKCSIRERRPEMCKRWFCEEGMELNND